MDKVEECLALMGCLFKVHGHDKRKLFDVYVWFCMLENGKSYHHQKNEADEKGHRHE